MIALLLSFLSVVAVGCTLVAIWDAGATRGWWPA